MRDDLAGRSLIRAALSAPYLERSEEHELAVRWKEDRDQQALHRITTAHMRLVISMAGRFRHFGLPLGDLIQEGPCRPARGGGALRAGARGPLFDLRVMVDQGVDPGLHLAQLVDRARRHEFGAEGAVLQPAAIAQPSGTRPRATLQCLHLPGNFGRAWRLGVGRRDDGFAPVGARHLAQRAAGRRHQRIVRPPWISWSPATRCRTRWLKRR